MAKQLAGTIDIAFYDIDEEKSFKVLAKMESDFKVKTPSPQELFFPDTVLFGYAQIMQSTKKLVELHLAHPEKWQRLSHKATPADSAVVKTVLNEKISTFTFIGLFAAGFVDGINPCAIATMIFLISFLGTQNRRRRDILIIGLSFSATVFITYFLIGLGAFRIISLSNKYYWVSLVIRYSAVIIAVTIAIISIMDAIRYYRTKDVKQIKDQLPKGLKMLIHKVIKGNLSNEKIVLGAVISGFFVTLLEGVCTAKIYLPTIVLMTRQVGFKLLGWALLVLYNLLFVTPLLIVLISAAYGMKWTKLATFTQKHLPLMKILLAVVLLALAAFISIR
jgi:cytochrome c biogenesis protein CcdA